MKLISSVLTADVFKSASVIFTVTSSPSVFAIFVTSLPSESTNSILAVVYAVHSALSPTQVSALSPIPSPSVSFVSVGSFGNTSELSPTPSLSVSVVSVASFGNASVSLQ